MVRSFNFGISKNAFRYGVAMLALLTPLLTIIGFGVFALSQHDQRVMILVLLSAISLTLFFIYKYLSREINSSLPSEISSLSDDLSEPSPLWRDSELALWNKAKGVIKEKLIEDDEVSTVFYKHTIFLSDYISGEMGRRSRYQITTIEMLNLTEELSSRYRKSLRENIPFIESLKINTVIDAFQMGEKIIGPIGKLMPIGSRLFSYYRNPIGQLLEDGTKHITGGKYDESVASLLKREFVLKVKFLFLQELTACLIHLYGGHFQLARDEIGLSKTLETDEAQLGIEKESLRIVIAGQVSSGKSSVANMIAGELLAEEDPLPSTNKCNVYKVTIDQKLDLRLVDLPGLDGSEAFEKITFEEVLQADLVIWVLKANHPARNLDKQLLDKLLAYYRYNSVTMKRAPIIAIGSQFDTLVEMSDFGSLSLLLNNDQQRLGERLMNHIRSIFDFDDVVLIGKTTNHEYFGLSDLKEKLVVNSERAFMSQLERRRRDSSEKNDSYLKQIKRTFSLTTSLAKVFWK